MDYVEGISKAPWNNHIANQAYMTAHISQRARCVNTHKIVLRLVIAALWPPVLRPTPALPPLSLRLVAIGCHAS